MIDVNEAVKIINQTQLALPIVEIPIENAVGRVLRQDIVADTDFPPFNRVMMDGIAIRWQDFEEGLRSFDIVGVQAAGSPQLSLQNPGACLEVMTGAVAPEGADTVVPYEDIEIDREGKKARVMLEKTSPGKNIHQKGTDKMEGDLLIGAGTWMDAPEVAIAASVGLTKVKVTRNPSVAIISTGNELVDISEKPLPHQIRRSNAYALQAELKKLGLKSTLFHLSDTKEVMLEKLSKILQEHQVLLMSGGVSKGKFDFVPEVLAELGVQKKFHRIRQKPGKPLMFGAKADQNVVFAFPGNPVSTFMCFHKYFLPWLRKVLGQKNNHFLQAVLAEEFSIKTGLTYFLQVKVSVHDSGLLLATPAMGKGSGDHANLLDSDAFLELPADTHHFKKGEVFNLIPFRMF